MIIPLYRPLNAPLVRLSTPIGARFFLLDTGCPVSFAQEVRQLEAGVWFEHQPLALRAAPFSLQPLSERLGVPVEGFIGLPQLSQHREVSFDFDQGRLLLGEDALKEPAHISPKMNTEVSPHEEPEPLTLALCAVREVMSAPIGVELTLDPSASAPQQLTAYLDLGSRFIVTPQGPPPAREAESPLYHLSLVTPQGAMESQVSAGHEVSVGGRLVSGLNVATGAPPMFPNILGMEWLSAHQASLSFTHRTLTLTPRAQASSGGLVSAWERFDAAHWAPPFELIFTPQRCDQPDRSFMVMPRAGLPLPQGLSPLTPYRLEGFEVPAGVEGVNALYEQLFVSEALAQRPFSLIDEAGQRVELKRVRLFQA